MQRVLELSSPVSDSETTLREVSDAILIYNPTSGRKRERRMHELAQASRILKEKGIHTERVPTTHPGSATEITREAVRGGCELVIACGGDGTINEVVNGLAGSHVPLAVLPAGTANILAKELEIPWNIPEAARMISGGTFCRVALGEIVWLDAQGISASAARRRYFLCVAGAGPDGAIVNGVDHRTKLRTGIFAYWKEGIRQFLRYRFPEFTIASEGKQISATLVVVGRTKHYGGPFQITRNASLFEDAFEIVAFTRRNRLLLLACLPAIWLGRLERVRGIEIWKTNQLDCKPLGTASVFAQVDGEPADNLPVQFNIVRDALTLVLPRNGERQTG
jgi:diacylglycerol kinase (ATP)